MKINSLNLLSFFIILLPIALLTGPFLPDLLVVLISIISLVSIISKNKWFYYKNIFFISFIVWCIYLFFVSTFSQNPWLSYESSLFYFRFGFFAVGIAYCINEKPIFIKYLFYSLLGAFSFVLIDSIIQFVTNYNIFGFPKIGVRLSGIFGKELILGSYLSRLMPILFAVFVYNFSNKLVRNKVFIFLVFLIYLVSDAVIYLSGERLAFAYLLITLFLTLLLIRKYRFYRFISFLASLLVIIVISFVYPSVKQRMIDDTLIQTNIFNTHDKEIVHDGINDYWSKGLEKNRILFFSPHHELSYKIAINIFKDNIYFGAGPKMFRQLCSEEKYFIEEGCTTHPHSIYLQLLSETGLIGALPIIFIFFFINYIFLKNFFYSFKGKNYLDSSTIIFLIAIYIYIWPLAPSGNFFNNWLSVIFYIPAGFIIQKYLDK